MKINLLMAVLISSLGVTISSCGNGSSNTTTGQSYYSASYSSYYNIQSSTENNESSLYLSIVSPGVQYVTNALLTPTLNIESQYEFSQNGASGTVTIKNGNLGISYVSQSSSWIDFATNTNNIANSVPNGTYNLICDQTNISACQLTINNNEVSIIEYSMTGQSTILCNNSSLQLDSSNQNPYLWQFNCGVNGGSTHGMWYMLPFVSNNQTSFLISEYNPTVNENDDLTDEIAFIKPIAQINPSGNYNYLYTGLSGGGVGITTVQFATSPASLINSITCGSLCGLNTNQYYSNQSQIGFDWYTNTTSSYNLVGNDAQQIYQDSYEGFYF